MKKSLIRLCAMLLMALFLLPFTGNKEARAEGESIYYLFTEYEVPEGQSVVFNVDTATLDVLRQQPELVNVFVAALAERYNTETAVIDQAAEAAYLSAVINGSEQGGIHFPVFTARASEGNEEIPLILPGVNGVLSTPVNMDINGGSYIDINITTQTLTLYQNGIAAVATPVVTGNLAAGHDTPEGLFSVLHKDLDRTLRGEDYEAFVHYWMRIVNNVGIHDASWRTDFGGQIYVSNGSHGCINVPPSVMPGLFAASPEGTPVWVHS